MLKLSLLISFCFYSAIAIAISKEEQDFLKDLPEPTVENLRYMIPFDYWPVHGRYILKGTFYAVEDLFLNQKNSIEGLRLYRDPKFKMSAGFVVKTSGTEAIDKSFYCYKGSVAKPLLLKRYAHCENFHCVEVDPSGLPQKVNEKLQLGWVKKWDNTPCPSTVDSEFKKLSDGKDYLLFKFDKVDPEGKYVEMSYEGKKYYMDIRKCTKEACGIKTIELSDYERDWIRLKKIQQKKNSHRFNNLIKELTPCVKKKDVKCVEKYFNYYPDKPKMVYDSDFWAELGACLSYDSLLPHLLGSRGIKKVCRFGEGYGLGDSRHERENSRFGTLYITYPEGVRSSDWKEMAISPIEY